MTEKEKAELETKNSLPERKPELKKHDPQKKGKKKK